LTDVNNSGIMQVPASLRSDLYSHQTGIHYSHRRNTQLRIPGHEASAEILSTFPASLVRQKYRPVLSNGLAPGLDPGTAARLTDPAYPAMTASSKTTRDGDRDRISFERQIQSRFLSRAVLANRNQSAGFFQFEMMTCTANTGSLALFSDGDLIRLTLDRQPDCFTALMDRHLEAVKRCIGFMLRGNGAAEDLAQEVVLKAWRFLSAFRAESSFRTWLTRVAINEVRQFQRCEIRASRFQELSNPDVLASQDESPYEHFARIQRTEAVRAVVNSLPAMYREVVMLRELEELSILEIAERLRCTVPAVKSRLFRGRSMLLGGVQKLQAATPKRMTVPPRVRPLTLALIQQR
jgi:RNA polymerase sigma-70 factor (ECF subfamily)